MNRRLFIKNFSFGVLGLIVPILGSIKSSQACYTNCFCHCNCYCNCYSDCYSDCYCDCYCNCYCY